MESKKTQSTMFCNQCQETAGNISCTKKGVCGKTSDVATYQDLLIYVLRGISHYELNGKEISAQTGEFAAKALFAAITNANFDHSAIKNLIKQALVIKKNIALKDSSVSYDSAVWDPKNESEYESKFASAGILNMSDDEDIRSLKALLLFGIKGVAAYADHAAVLGLRDQDIYRFIFTALAALDKDLSADELVGLVLSAGEAAVKAMSLLDKANTSKYGNPEISKVSISARNNPGILISGHDLKDMEELLEQTENSGIDVYTHGEMLPANYYPAFKKYKHLAGNYGGSWWKQAEEFESFNGPILMTTNCIIPVKDSYKNRIFTTGMAGYPGVQHISDRKPGGKKDFSEIIKLARSCKPPVSIEEGEIVGGFAHNQVLALADKVVEAVKSGAIKKFVVMAGCDGRHNSRQYFTQVAEKLPKDTVILTAGCAKYRYNKLKLGDINGIPRVLDAGQCNDSYSLAVIALKLKEVFGLDDINKLPIAFDIAWYEQKAVAVLLALLFLGFKNIRMGPTLPGFLSPNVAKIISETFGLKQTAEAQSDINAMV